MPAVCDARCLNILVKPSNSVIFIEGYEKLFQYIKYSCKIMITCAISFFQLTLNLLTSISKTHKSCMASLHNEILPQILLLIQSPLLQGGALTALLELFQALVLTGLPKHGFRDFLQVLVVGTITVESFMFVRDSQYILCGFLRYPLLTN